MGERVRQALRCVARRKAAIAEIVGQARGVAEQPPYGDGVVVVSARRQVPALEIARRRRVEIDAAVLDQRHHAERRHPFAHRGDLEQRVAVDRLAVRGVIGLRHLAVHEQRERYIAFRLRGIAGLGRGEEGGGVAARDGHGPPPAFVGPGRDQPGPDDQRGDRRKRDTQPPPHDATPPPCARPRPAPRSCSRRVFPGCGGRWPASART
jgi:hypothetical protein